MELRATVSDSSVADAIAKGDPERARKAMFDIVDEVARALNFF